jgi:hypothetical protein
VKHLSGSSCLCTQCGSAQGCFLIILQKTPPLECCRQMWVWFECTITYHPPYFWFHCKHATRQTVTLTCYLRTFVCWLQDLQLRIIYRGILTSRGSRPVVVWSICPRYSNTQVNINNCTGTVSSSAEDSRQMLLLSNSGVQFRVRSNQASDRIMDTSSRFLQGLLSLLII